MKETKSIPHAQQCQWMEGIQDLNVSIWQTCKHKAVFKVFQDGVMVGRVCYGCSRKAELHGWQIKAL